MGLVSWEVGEVKETDKDHQGKRPKGKLYNIHIRKYITNFIRSEDKMYQWEREKKKFNNKKIEKKRIIRKMK